jgi:alkanesulfonate monooxygenase SsuD/methylene tetrahydromethanopterin reductase-like flavin-dependent oxidoreductase (luciferase family)
LEVTMQIGIGLPATIPWAPAQLTLDWARRADSGPFSSLAILDRVVYGNHEPIVILSAAAAVTQRIRLTTCVLLAPTRNAGILAKEAASIDALSGGRLTLGLGVGFREDDFRAAPATYHDRGRRFEGQLDLMKRIWSGQAPHEGIGPVGPQPAQQGGPELLLGGYTPAAIGRIGRWADGFIAGGVDPATSQQLYGLAQESWKAAGRSGKPRFVAANYFALGPNASRGGDYIRDYYAFMGEAGEQSANELPSTPGAVKDAIRAYADVGADEFILLPTVAELDQVDRLAELVR